MFKRRLKKMEEQLIKVERIKMKMAVDCVLVLLQIILLLCHQTKASKPSMCRYECGGVDIRYPFGIGEGCYSDTSFEVVCNNSAGSEKAFLKSVNLELSSYLYYINSPTIEVNVSAISLNSSNANAKGVNLTGTPFSFSQMGNWFIVIGCDNYIDQKNDSKNPRACWSVCTCKPRQNSGCCYMLCKMNSTQVVDVNTSYLYFQKISSQGCRSVSIVDQSFEIELVTSNVLNNGEAVPVRLDWGKYRGRCSEEYNSDTEKCNLDGNCFVQLDSGYLCLCNSNKSSSGDICEGSLICNTTSGYSCSECPSGYYQELEYCYSITSRFGKKSRDKFIIIGGISGGLGMLFLLTGALWLYKFVKRRREIKLKKKFFKKNGGLLLQQELSSTEGNIQKTKLFTSKELEKATDNFNMNRILGQGGQGTVYKGMMADGKIVAVKKSKVIDESKVEEFINEVVILSQINHRNVVKLLGCCLETEVPLLVYEFIPNGTLFQYIHDQSEEFPITWEMRLRMAVEVSGALSYLHSAASIPIYHRDIKSMNILLDEKYHAKVSDFGASRSMVVDQTHMTTKVQGTFGYLDPEYFRSSQFTEKSDVYSFGVVLAELLTGERPIRLINSEEDRSLAAYFLCAMKEDRLFEILDAHVMNEGGKDEIITVAKLAKICLNLNGKKRPTMREVAMELGGIRVCNGVSHIVRESLEESVSVDGDIARDFETDESSTGSVFDSITVSVDADPIISNIC